MIWPKYTKKDIRTASAIRIDMLDRYIPEEWTDLINSPYVQYLAIEGT
jgi:hypothetical protein